MSTLCEDVPETQDVPDLVPARMLNEFTYCPRLAYLEWVQGEFADNLETREGRFGHRRVDHADRQELPPLECGGSPPLSSDAESAEAETVMKSDGKPSHSKEDTIHARSVMLSAPSEGLIAKMDLIDLAGGVAVPVDYKRGRVPDVPGQAWEPEMVQLCAQGLILRENGYQCEGGILYYIESKRRVSVPFDDALVERTRQLLREMRQMGAARVMPPPLEDSPKCPRCSLVGICLPDEVNLLTLDWHGKAPSPPAPLPEGEGSNVEPAAARPEGEGSNVEPAAARPEGEGSPYAAAGPVLPAPRTVLHATTDVRRLMPARDDALPLYVQEQGVTLGKSGEVLTVKRRDEVLQKVKLKDVSQVCLLGSVQLTAQALREIATAGIPICHLSYGGWFHAMTTGLVHKNVELRIAQFHTAGEAEESLRIARQIVLGKIKNCRTLLRRNFRAVQGKLEDAENDSAASELEQWAADQLLGGKAVAGNGASPHPDPLPEGDGTDRTHAVGLQKGEANLLLHRLDDLARKAERVADMPSLLGIEGMAGKVYFEGFSTLLSGDAAFDFESRNRRPPRDPVNALLSFVYAMLTKDLTLTLLAVGFDPMLGFYHQPRYGRPSLALDLVEEFRPIVADSVVLTLINNGEVSASSFLRRGGGCVLTDAGRRAVIAAYERRMDSLVTHPISGYRISYRRVLEVQSRLLARAVLGELAEYPCFYTR